MSAGKSRNVAKAKDYLGRGVCLIGESSVMGCCATRYLLGFRQDDYLKSVPYTPKTCAKAMSQTIEGLVDTLRRTDCSVVMASVNTKQRLAAEALEGAGFVAGPWMFRKPSSSYATGVKIFVKSLYPERTAP